MRWKHEHDFDAEIQAAVTRAGVPLLLTRALIAQESGFDPNVVRGEPQLGDASIGLMQVLLSTARRYHPGITVEQLKEPAVNVGIGTQLLADLLHQAGGDWWRAASAYNGGWRPELGFGTVLPAPKTICLAWKASAPTTGRTIARDCAKPYTAQAGEFGNQPYVNDVAELVNYMGRDLNGIAQPTSKGKIAGLVALALIGGGLLLAARSGA